MLNNGDILTQDPRIRTRTRSPPAAGSSSPSTTPDKLVGPKTRVIDLHGRAVVPSLTDAHAHLVGLGFAARAGRSARLRSADDCAAARRRKKPTARRVDARPRLGSEPLARRQVPDARGARRASPDGRSGSSASTATPAGPTPRRMRRGRDHDATRRTPPDGQIVRDKDGEADRRLRRRRDGLWSDSACPSPTRADVKRAILARAGASRSPGPDRGPRRRDLADDGRRLPRARPPTASSSCASTRWPRRRRAREVEFVSRPPAKPAPDGSDSSCAAIKLFIDGALGSRGAALLAPYADDPGNTRPAPDRAQGARGDVDRGARGTAGRSPPTPSAIAAIAMVLDAYAAALKAVPRPRDPRLRIEHAQVVRKQDIARFAQLGVIASMQPSHATQRHAVGRGARSAPSASTAPTPGARARRRRARWPSAATSRSRSRASSPDITPPSSAAAGRVDQKLTLDETLRAFTSGAAYAAFEEDWRGRAAPGMAADLTVFDRAAADLVHARADTTIVGRSRRLRTALNFHARVVFSPHDLAPPLPSGTIAAAAAMTPPQPPRRAPPPSRRRSSILGGTGFLGPRAGRGRARARPHGDAVQPRQDQPRAVPRRREAARRSRRPPRGARRTASGTRSSTRPATCRGSCSDSADAARAATSGSTSSSRRSRSTPTLEQAASTRSSPRRTLEEPTTEDVDGETTAPLKALCEQAAEEAMPGRVAHRAARAHRRAPAIRPIASPTGRCAWRAAARCSRPATPTDPVQCIDVRDLAAWIIWRLVEKRHRSARTTRSGPARHARRRRHARRHATRASAATPTLTWVDADSSTKQKVQPWSDMPVWIPPVGDGKYSGLHHAARARSAPG